MGNCSSAPRLKVNLRAFIAANPSQEGYGDDWYFETMNVLLDRWTYSHVQFLRKKFLEATGDKGEKELDKKGFFKLFAELQDMPKAVAESAFRMFDTDNSGKLNFREFCCALALCGHLMSSDDEKIRFVFDMFDTNDDGLLSSADVQLLLEYAFQKDDPSRALEGFAGDGDKAIQERKQQRVADLKQDLLGNSQQLTYERFYEWAMKNIDSLTNLLHTFQLVPSPERERTICEEILNRHQTLSEGGTWYCISHKWLQVWKAHANWKGPSPGRRLSTVSTSSGHGLLVVHGSSSTDAREKRPGVDVELQDLDHVDDAASDFGLGVLNESVAGAHHGSSRPPEIDNSDLEGEHKGELKMNLVEHLDYELIPEEMWHRLVEWYGGGPSIPRKVICLGEDHKPQVELYPPLVLVVAAGESGQPLPQFSRRFFISRQTSLEEVLHMLAEKLSRPAERSRLWHRAKGEQWQAVSQMGIVLDEFLEGKVWDAGAFMLETQKLNGEWPRDSMTERSQPLSPPPDSDTWSVGDAGGRFEVGDRVEAQNGVTNQWTRGTIVDVIQRDHSTAPSQVKVHYDSTVYKCDEWISTSSDRLAPLDTHTTEHPATSSTTSARRENEGPAPIRGATGLQNLGNTCFLNATIQCLANTPLMREYFLSSQYMRDINDTGKLGCKGRLAEEFGHVLSDLWAAKSAQLSPRNLKRTIDQFAPQFAGYEQHDAQELLAFFLDGLHEDLNRLGIPGTNGRMTGLRREADRTPKLFSRGKPRHNYESPNSPNGKRTKNAWRERLGDGRSDHSLRDHSLPSLSGTLRIETGSVNTEAQSVTSSTTTPTLVQEQFAIDDDPIRSIEANAADPGNVEDGVDALSMSTDLPEDEAYRKVERLVHPTMLWSRPRPGGPFTGDEDARRALNSAEDMQPSPEETLPSNPKVSSPGLGAMGVGLVRQMPGGVDDQQQFPLEASVECFVVEGRDAVEAVSLMPGAKADETGAVLEFSEVFGDDRLSQGKNESRSAQAGDRLGDDCDAPVPSEDPVPVPAATALTPRIPDEGMRTATASYSEVRPASQPSTSAADRRPHGQESPVATSGSRPTSSGNARARDDSKRQGTSRWWSFAWRRGRGALDLPKDGQIDNSCQAEIPRDAHSPPRSRATEALQPLSSHASELQPLPEISPRPGEDDGFSFASDNRCLPSQDGAAIAQEPQCGAFGDAAMLEASEAPELARDEMRSTSKLPAGAAVAAVTAAAAVRGASHAEVSEDSTIGTFNESEEVMPELLTPARPSSSSRRGWVFSRSFRRRKDGDESGNTSPGKRRPRTPPTMSPLREEMPGIVADERKAMCILDDGTLMPQDLGVSGEISLPDGSAQGSDLLVSTATPASSSRSFLPWKGKRAAYDRQQRSEPGTREASCEEGEETDGEGRRREGSRGGRTKEKESSWPSFLRRAKSREGSMTRRTRGPRPTGSAPPTSAGDSGTADEQWDGPRAESRPSSDEGVRAERRDLSNEPRRGSDIESGPEDGTRPARPSGLGMFLRAPWKRDARSPVKRSLEPQRTSLEQQRHDSEDEFVRPQVLGGRSNEDTPEPSDTASRDEAGDAEARKAQPSAQEAPPDTPRDSMRDAPGADAASQVARESVLREAAKEALNASGGNTGGKDASEDRSSADAPPGAQTTQSADESHGAEDEETDEDNLPDEEKAARQWERYRARNRSLIVDIFEGQLRSQLTCCQCGTSSSTFEPFRYLSVPIPSNHVDHASLRIVFFPLPFSREEERPQLSRFSVCVPKSSTVQKVERALSTLLPVPMTSVLLAEVYRSRIHRYLDTSLPLSDVRAEDQLFAFEVLQTPQELMQYQERHAPSRHRREKAEELKKQPNPRVLLIQAMHRRVVDVQRSDGRTWAQRREVFGLPFVMSAASSWTYATLHDMLMLHARRFLRNQRRDRRVDVADQQAAQMPFVARIVNASGTACGACDRRNCTGCLLPKGNSRLRLRAGLLTGAVSTAKIYLALDWVDSGVYDQDYVDAVADDPSVARASATEVDRDGADTDRSHKSHGEDSRGRIPISTCIDAFAQPEELKEEFGNGVKCEKCNKVVDAVKKLEIWREPDVLIIHIKRFHFSGVHYEKLNTPVDVPWRELNLRPWIVGPMAANSAPYELYAIACHWGGMSGGHYTSFCANQEGKEPVWLKFNDDVVNSVSLQQELDEISKQCYVLFYRKRAFSSSNLINYSSLL